MAERAGIFDSAGDFDIAGFAAKTPKTEKSEAAADAIRAVSEASSFRSREPAAAKVEQAPRREPRRYRTGRNVQLNVKVSAETLAAFHAIADSQGWVLGETLEQAVAALEREMAERAARTLLP
jgi:hypothetical protein